MIKKLSIFTFLGLLFMNGNAQTVLSLSDCIKIGIENNLTLQSKKNEIEKNRLTVSENRSKLIPQINAFANFNDNFEPPVSVTDGSAYGNPYNVTKTLQYGANAGFQLQMPLYNQTVYTSVSIARTMEEISRLGYEKAKEDLTMEISKMYYLGQASAEQISLIKANIARLEELKGITEAFYDNGMAMEVDVKRVSINLETCRCSTTMPVPCSHSSSTC